ncbi:MAG: hypothetical protein P8Q41_02760 [Saprospiraceae bacterium]|nr:hypothetical protein [Saprospiraceae bacterium]
MKILNKILRQNNNIWQIVGAIIGSFMGLLLLLLSIQFYIDLNDLTESEDQFVIINKEVSSFGAKAKFTPEEIQKIQDQPFIKKVGQFSASNYRVSAGSALLNFRTDLFFESVPDEFVDVKSEDFKWSKGDIVIPVVVARDYLALYNFGFAASQGLPKIPFESIQEVSLDVLIKGQGKRKNFKGRIVGFSDRINSIIVPQSFMEYSNKNFQDYEPKGSSRLIISSDNPFSDTFRNFMKDNGYELSSGRLIGGETAALIRTLIAVVAVIGFLIVLLSVFIFVLNFQLMVSKSSRDIRLMLQLGYKQNQIGQILKKHLMFLFGMVMLLTILFFGIFRSFIVSFFTKQGMEFEFVNPIVLLAGLLFAGLFVFINYKNIESSIRNLSS